MVTFTKKFTSILPTDDTKKRICITDIEGNYDKYVLVVRKLQQLNLDINVDHTKCVIEFNHGGKGKRTNLEKIALGELLNDDNHTNITLTPDLTLKTKPSPKSAELVFVPKFNEIGVYNYNRSTLATNDGAVYSVDLEKEEYVGLKKSLKRSLVPDIFSNEQKELKQIAKMLESSDLPDDLVGVRVVVKDYADIAKEFGETAVKASTYDLTYANPRSQLYGVPYFKAASHYAKRPATIRSFDQKLGIVTLEFDDTVGVTEHTKLIFDGGEEREANSPIYFHIDHICALKEETTEK
jgi:hypothetical protein